MEVRHDIADQSKAIVYHFEDLPDLVIHKICSFLDCPFDLLHFGCTCRRLQELTASFSLWLPRAIHWCNGLWPWLPDIPSAVDPQKWLLEVFNLCTSDTTTKLHCSYDNGEEWIRIESRKFRCCLGMLRYSYAERDEKYHPAVLFQRWLYDIGLFKRQNSKYQFHEDIKLSESSIRELAALGQAAERDLRARKRPHINPIYYVKKISVSQNHWMENLFPSGASGSICPLLMCPSEAGFASEISGISGLIMCVSIVLANHLQPQCLSGNLLLPQMAHIIRTACKSLRRTITSILPLFQQQWGSACIVQMVNVLAEEEDSPFLEAWQKELDTFEMNLISSHILRDLSELFLKYQWLDALVDSVRERWRHSLLDEICSTLKGTDIGPCSVTRVNLTDSDFIGGDNRRQEMASAAFISKCGVLVTWQLVGRERY